MATAKKTSKVLDGAAAFDRFLPETRAVTRVLPMKAEGALARRTVARAVEVVMRHEIRIRRELPEVDVKMLRELPDLALAITFAAAEVVRATPPKQDAKQLLWRARAVRATLLSAAEKLAAAGILETAEVKKVRQGLGPLNSAREVVALAALFRKRATAIKGKTTVKAATIDEAEELGAELVNRLKPTAGGRPAPTLTAATAARDKLWTLLVRRYEILWRAGAYILGRDVDRVVPKLQSNTKRKRAPLA